MGRLDVRAQIETYDNAVLYLTYEGVIEMNERVQTALAEGTETAYEDQYFRTTPRLETGDERYAWVNQTVFFGRGGSTPARACSTASTASTEALGGASTSAISTRT